jgi:hypothetical protein
MLSSCYCHEIAVRLPCWQYGSSDFRQAAWATAAELSNASGNPWTDRHGTVHNAEPAGITEAVLAKWFARRGVPMQ